MMPPDRRPYVGAAVHWVYAGWFPDKLVGKPTAAVVVRVTDAERGRVDLQAFKLDCHGCILMRDVEYNGDGAPGTWHWRGE